MGSTLTNTQPKDTYKSLLKTSDSTELSGTAKYVSDGNGNDSALALSTSAVGIGTDSPTTTLEVSKNDAVTNDSSNALEITHTSSGTTANGFGVGLGFRIENSTYGVINEVGRIEVVETDQPVLNDAMVFYVKTNNTMTEMVRIIPSGGLTFNGDTAAANALDDYEEGTWTPTYVAPGVTFTHATQYGRYTKIGRQVIAQIYIRATAGTGTTSNAVTIDGLPFVSNSDGLAQSAGTVWYSGSSNITPLSISNSTAFYLWINSTTAGLSANDVINGEYLVGTLMYFV